MSERQPSLADCFVYVANEIQKIDADVSNENPHRYPLRKMRMVADRIISDALQSAQDIADTARIFKDEMSKKERQEP